MPAKGIAIIGMAGRFGSASSVGEFWRSLEAGRSLVREVPPERWSAAEHWDPEPGKPLRTISKWGAFLEGIDRFDADFFSISPKEAAAMDPQQRLFLEQAWLALENAGYPQGSLKGRQVGVYVGASPSGYEATVGANDRAADAYLMTGNLTSLLASRIAYFLDLRGPALTIDTACSSALVAVDLARQALERGEIEMALVGGVSLFLDEKPFLLMSRAGMLAADGRCKSFDARADGIVLGEAVGAVILKPLTKALADGDRIDAVMLASGTNQDGHSNGITAPNSEAQAELIRTVVARAGVPAWSVGYVEAHGTGTPLGDPIELAGLRGAFEPRPEGAQACRIGTVKTNLGHTSEAAGLAGLVKAVLSLKAQMLPPSLNFEKPNARIDFGDGAFVVNDRLERWEPTDKSPRRAGVSAFGLAGTNAHAVLEEAPAAAYSAWSGPVLIALSARSPKALAQRARELAACAEAEGASLDLGDLACTLLVGRTAFAHRAAFVAKDRADVLRGLHALGSETVDPIIVAGRVGRGATDPTRDVAAERLIANAGARADADTLQELARAYVEGAAPDWRGLLPGRRRTLDLPGYPFERASHWLMRRGEVQAGPLERRTLGRGPGDPRSPAGRQARGARGGAARADPRGCLARTGRHRTAPGALAASAGDSGGGSDRQGYARRSRLCRRGGRHAVRSPRRSRRRMRRRPPPDLRSQRSAAGRRAISRAPISPVPCPAWSWVRPIGASTRSGSARMRRWLGWRRRANPGSRASRPGSSMRRSRRQWRSWPRAMAPGRRRECR